MQREATKSHVQTTVAFKGLENNVFFEIKRVAWLKPEMCLLCLHGEANKIVDNLRPSLPAGQPCHKLSSEVVKYSLLHPATCCSKCAACTCTCQNAYLLVHISTISTVCKILRFVLHCDITATYGNFRAELARPYTVKLRITLKTVASGGLVSSRVHII